MASKYLNVHEIKSSFSAYAKEVLKGKSFILAIRNKPFAELRPLHSEAKPITFGVLKKAFVVPENFDAPLDHFERSFYGRK